mmetsp:Transcript_18398/g.32944  ORF Transcript_18398/g.32944 Transcript_18398/m.32944 type:complete len:200 (-) Transcript_18398:170-769(-)
MFCVHLLLLQGGTHVNEFVQQLLQHINDCARLELICVCLWGVGIKRHFIHALGKEQINGLLRFRRDKIQVLQSCNLCQGFLLLSVICLFFQDCDCTLECVYGLRVILVGGIIVGLLNGAHLGCCLDVAIPHRNVLIMSCDLLGQLSSISRVFLNVCTQHIDFLLSLGDGTALLNIKVIAELLVSSKLHLLCVFLLLALC